MSSKLYFEKELKEEERRKIYFTSYLRRDFVERSAVLTTEGNRLVHAYLSSYVLGSVEWHAGSGLSECRVWESEDQAREPTYLTRRYTMRLSDGAAGNGYAVDRLVPDVLDGMADRNVAEQLELIILGRRAAGDVVIDTDVLEERPQEAWEPNPPSMRFRSSLDRDEKEGRQGYGISIDRAIGSLKGMASGMLALFSKALRGGTDDSMKKPQILTGDSRKIDQAAGRNDDTRSQKNTDDDRVKKARDLARRIAGKKKR